MIQLRLPLAAPEGIRIRPDFAYALYGFWMERLPPGQAEYIHETHAVNQYLAVSGGTAELVANLLTERAAAYMLPLLRQTRAYPLVRHGCTLTTGKLRSREFGEAELLAPLLASRPAVRQITIRLVTPVTFKTENHYAVFPTPELILHSAASKWNALGLRATVDDPEALRQMTERTWITDYRLRSTRFYMKDTRIQSFQGELTLSVRGPEPMLRLFDALIGSLCFTGLGIKTTLGMGGVEILPTGGSP